MRSEVTEMGWDRGRYYTRSKKVNGRLVREYVGGGELAERAARVDAIERQRRENEAADRRAERDELAALDADLQALNETADLAARATLLAAGFQQHKRGEWRKKRVSHTGAAEARGDGPAGAAEADGTSPAR
jgi:hypothetical protein